MKINNSSKSINENEMLAEGISISSLVLSFLLFNIYWDFYKRSRLYHRISTTVSSMLSNSSSQEIRNNIHDTLLWIIICDVCISLRSTLIVELKMSSVANGSWGCLLTTTTEAVLIIALSSLHLVLTHQLVVCRMLKISGTIHKKKRKRRSFHRRSLNGDESSHSYVKNYDIDIKSTTTTTTTTISSENITISSENIIITTSTMTTTALSVPKNSFSGSNHSNSNVTVNNIATNNIKHSKSYITGIGTCSSIMTPPSSFFNDKSHSFSSRFLRNSFSSPLIKKRHPFIFIIFASCFGGIVALISSILGSSSCNAQTGIMIWILSVYLLITLLVCIGIMLLNIMEWHIGRTSSLITCRVSMFVYTFILTWVWVLLDFLSGENGYSSTFLGTMAGIILSGGLGILHFICWVITPYVMKQENYYDINQQSKSCCKCCLIGISRSSDQDKKSTISSSDEMGIAWSHLDYYSVVTTKGLHAVSDSKMETESENCYHLYDDMNQQ